MAPINGIHIWRCHFFLLLTPGGIIKGDRIEIHSREDNTFTNIPFPWFLLLGCNSQAQESVDPRNRL